ncbi:GNAT family N-acetyltransferase [Rhexocercosporidium sp. MPI-PUGE-AT-0058]|nr:GNAT family N-acetyltransferase [Rhexocercosporidium sp. MPI-PUGE-AT-0058]
MESNIVIKRASPVHIPSINAILTHYALHTVITFATAGISDQELLAKFQSITSDHQLPFYVATDEEQEEREEEVVVGYTYISPFRPERLAYIHTGEVSLYVHPEHLYKGIGSALLKRVLEATQRTRIREVLAFMAVDVESREGGLGLRDFYVRWGFKEAGRMERVGWKLGRW